MKNKIIIGFIFLIITWIITYILEKADTNPYRYFSISLQESEKSKALIKSYRLSTNTSFLNVKESWVEKSSSYKDEKIFKIDDKKAHFLIVFDELQNKQLFGVDWIIKIDRSLGGYYQNGNSQIFFFENDTFRDSIYVEVESPKTKKVLEKMVFIKN